MRNDPRPTRPLPTPQNRNVYIEALLVCVSVCVMNEKLDFVFISNEGKF